MSDDIRTNASGARAGARPGGLACHVVKDLLPLYADGLTSEETSQAIKEHLTDCKDCSREYRAMTGGPASEFGAPEPASSLASAQEKQEAGMQIDYLKKVRKRSHKAAIIVGCVALLVLAGLGWRFFVRGGVDKQLHFIARVKEEDPREVRIEAFTDGSGMAISGIDISEKDGIVKVSGRTALAGIRKKGELSRSYTASADVKQIVDAAGRILWENGTMINEYVGNIYAKKVKYVGNASAVNALKLAVWRPSTDMPYGPLELQTANEPYGIRITLGADQDQPEGISQYLENVAKRHACYMLALVDNLGYAEYEVHTGRSVAGQKEVIQIRMTADEALESVKEAASKRAEGSESTEFVLAAKSIKDFAKSAYACEMLDEVLMTHHFSQYSYQWQGDY